MRDWRSGLLFVLVSASAASAATRFERLLDDAPLRKAINTLKETKSPEAAGKMAHGLVEKYGTNCFEESDVDSLFNPKNFPDEIRSSIEGDLKKLSDNVCPSYIAPRRDAPFDNRKVKSEKDNTVWTSVLGKQWRRVDSLAADDDLMLAATSSGFFVSHDGSKWDHPAVRNNAVDRQEFHAVALAGDFAFAGGTRGSQPYSLYLQVSRNLPYTELKLPVNSVFAIAATSRRIFLGTDQGVIVDQIAKPAVISGRPNTTRRFGAMATLGDKLLAGAGVLGKFESNGAYLYKNDDWEDLPGMPRDPRTNRFPQVTALAAGSGRELAGTADGHIYELCPNEAIKGSEGWQDLPFRESAVISAIWPTEMGVYVADSWRVFYAPVPECKAPPNLKDIWEPRTGNLTDAIHALAIFKGNLYAGTESNLFRTPLQPKDPPAAPKKAAP